jgi:glycosyltransferase involved in cell wall biosynthesis
MPYKIGIIHYTAPSVMGGVEGVIAAHLRLFSNDGHFVRVIAGRGEVLPQQTGATVVESLIIPEMDSRFDGILRLNPELYKGIIPDGFDSLTEHLATLLQPVLADLDYVFVHNVLTMHLNLALTAAIVRLLDEGHIKHLINWAHDFSHASKRKETRNKVNHPGYPWELLKAYIPDITYVTGSSKRQHILAGMLDCSPKAIHVIGNGVDPYRLLRIGEVAQELVSTFDLLNSDLNILMPVRISQAKNIEYAMKVIAEIKKLHINSKLIITGPPDPHDPKAKDVYSQLRTKREELGLQDSIRFVYETGANSSREIDYETVGDLLRVADIVLMTSLREGFGIPVLEGSLARIPVWASTNVPAIHEIDGTEINTFSLDETSQSLARRIVQWRANSKLHQVRERVRKYHTWQYIYDNKIKLLLDAIHA